MPASPDNHSRCITGKNTLLTTSATFAVLAIVCLLGGCASISRNIFDPAADASRVPPLIRSDECRDFPYNTKWGDPATWKNPFWKNPCESQNLSLTRPANICPYVPKTDKKDDDGKQEDDYKKPDLRECADSYETASDKICTVHLSKIFGNRAVTNATLGIVASGTGIAGSLVTGTAANALSGSAGFITADRSILNEEIYRNYVAEAIIKEIIDNRKTLKANIYADIEKGAASTSPITGPQGVLQRVLEYHNACSFYAGLTSLLGKAGVSGQKASDVKKNLDGQITTLNETIENLDEEIAKENKEHPGSDLYKSLLAKRSTYQDQLFAYKTARNSITGVVPSSADSPKDSNSRTGSTQP